MREPTQEYKLFQSLELKGPTNEIITPDHLFDITSRYYPLLEFVYKKTRLLYSSIGLRKNGKESFIHPLNVVLALKRAKISDPLTIAAGILHDYVEEQVDIFEETLNVPHTNEGYIMLEEYELSVFEELESELELVAIQYKYSPKDVQIILDTILLLTRHKRHFYLKSISYIFNCTDKKIKDRAIQIKLADRIHNVLSIECFGEEDRIYQCFKNLFILNNTKYYLVKTYGKNVFSKSNPMERLFNWCSKATYDAFLTICALAAAQGIEEIKSLLHLAFKKYMLEEEGIWKVTRLDPNESHPMRLYQNIVSKYDLRLHQEFKLYHKLSVLEREYCIKFFASFHFSDTQINAILHYKDAYALKEVVARLIYQPSYVISGFLVKELSENGRIQIDQKKQLSSAFPNFFKRSAGARL